MSTIFSIKKGNKIFSSKCRFIFRFLGNTEFRRCLIMSKKFNFNRKLAGKGYYIALGLCAAAIGIAGFLYYRNAEKPAPTPSAMDETLGNHQAVIATGPNDTANPEPGGNDAPRTPLKTVSPLEGETLAVYAMDSLTYNQTTRDWRVHNGVDIAADAGSTVCAAAAGEVYSVYDDEAMGMTVVIRHQDGYTTRYASLAETVAVKPGEQVAAGQTIGAVGNTALMESAIGDHLHFSVTRDGASVNPADFLALN